MKAPLSVTPPPDFAAAARRRLEAMRGRRILVVGDLMLDRYVYGTVERISPEAPVPVVRVTRETLMPGGAGNVAVNLRAMGGEAAVAGFIGRDREGRELAGLLRHRGVRLDATIETRGQPTTVKTRIVAERQQVVRVDRDGASPLTPAEMARFRRAVAAAAARADGVILADYGKGALTQPVVDAALKAARSAGIPTGLDPKNRDLRVAGVTVVTPNRKEAFHIAGRADPGATEDPLRDAPLLDAAEQVLRRWRPRHLIVTLGPHGMLLAQRGAAPLHVPTRAREVFDVSGAGDTVIAVCVLALAAGADIVEAAELANYAAGVVVGKMGTATCAPEELLAALERGGD